MMARKCYVQIDGVLYDKEDLARGIGPTERALQGYRGRQAPGHEGSRGPAIIPDLPDFVSPIDRRVYSGRAGMRDHCARHDVVPTAELAGLPTAMPVRSPSKAEIREKIIEVMHRKGYWDGN